MFWPNSYAASNLDSVPNDSVKEKEEAERSAPPAQTPDDDLKQQLAFNLDTALIELRAIDLILERRPALSGLKDRCAKIERAIAAAGRLDGLLRRYGTHKDGCLSRPDCSCGWDAIEKELRGAPEV